MDDWFNTIRSVNSLAPDVARTLERDGFVVLPGPVLNASAGELAVAYDAAVASAAPSDVHVGRASTRGGDFVSRQEFDGLYLYAPLLAACGDVIGRPFKLSSLHARTLHANVPADELHVDLSRDSDAWPLVGFILMIDPFRSDNGATQFVPGSHRRLHGPGEYAAQATPIDATETTIQACGSAGALLVFNGSTWHGHSANISDAPRRSIQGAFIPREAKTAVDWSTRLGAETSSRLSPLARYLLALPG
jgi:Phytanoyl-CoA dioxygenase (PhyH)